MRFGFVDEHKNVWPIRVMCRVLGVSVSGYYAWRSRSESRRTIEDRGLLGDIRLAHAESGGAYGARVSMPCSMPSAGRLAATAWRA